MRIRCPFCGDRAHAEFAYLGDAGPSRPKIEGRVSARPDPTLFLDYVYARTNPPGMLSEYWQHVGGCRAWLVVDRNVTTHEIFKVAVAREVVLGRSGSEAR